MCEQCGDDGMEYFPIMCGGTEAAEPEDVKKYFPVAYSRVRENDEDIKPLPLALFPPELEEAIQRQREKDLNNSGLIEDLIGDMEGEDIKPLPQIEFPQKLEAIVQNVIAKGLKRSVIVEQMLGKCEEPVYTETLFIDLCSGPWIMKVRTERGETRILFNREHYPNLCPDDFAKKVVKIIEEMPLVKAQLLKFPEER